MPLVNGKYVFQSNDPSKLQPLNEFDQFVDTYSKSSMGAFDNPVKRFEGFLDDYTDYVNLSTTPLSSDWNELRALDQSNLERFGNGLVKFGGNAAITFLDGTVGLVAGIGSAMTGGEFIDNPFSNALHEMSNAMNEKFQNYETPNDILF